MSLKYLGTFVVVSTRFQHRSQGTTLGTIWAVVVSVLDFYSVDSSSNAAEVCNFYLNILFEKTEIIKTRSRLHLQKLKVPTIQ